MLNPIKLDMRCPMCGQTHSVVVEEGDFLEWQNGELIQRAMPDLSIVEREQLISHICPKCQAIIFEE